MSKNKKKVRSEFREAVLARDKNKCRCCSYEIDALLLDAHHITDRNLMPNGGYVKENGISLCPDCHRKAEFYHLTDEQDWFDGFHPSDLYKLIGSSYEIACEKSNKLKGG
jgi:5-methylcytosine-specific restriction endonuclease McrA